MISIEKQRTVKFSSDQQMVSNHWARRIASAICPKAVLKLVNESVLAYHPEERADTMRTAMIKSAVKMNPAIKGKGISVPA